MLLSASFSTGHVAYMHDIRKSFKENITRELSKDNIILKDILQGRTVEEYLDELMVPYIEQYNAKQKREERKIRTGYCEWHNNNKTLKQSKLVYEAVAQFGEHENLGKLYYESTGEQREKMHRYFEMQYTKLLEEFERKYPHLHVLWATIHFDEERGTPHIHIAYTPIGTFEKQGLSHKVSIGRALEQDGIKRVKSRAEAVKLGGYQLARLYKDIKQSMEQELIRQGHTIKQEEHDKKHQTVEEWEAIQELQQEKAQMQKEVEQTIKRAEAYMTYEQELKAIHEAANRPKTNTSEVQRVQVKDGFRKTKEMVQLSPENFEAYKSSADTKAIERSVEMKIQQQTQATKKLMQSITTEKEEQLQEQIHNLQQEVQEVRRQLKEKDKVINRLRKNLQLVKEFLQSLNIYHRFTQWLEHKQIEREEFHFDGYNQD